jgi:hypothetical protein
MRDILSRLRPVFEGEGTGGGGGNGGNDGGGAWTPPQGLPAEYAGKDANETLGKLLGGFTDVNTRFTGLREKLSKMPSAPEKPDAYTFEPDEKLKPYFGDVGNNPAFGHARTAAHKYGLSQEQFAGFISETYQPMVEAGLLPKPFDPTAEVKGFMSATGMDIKGTHEALAANETFAKGLSSQLKDIPEAMKADVEATLLGLTDTAVGNVLIKALSGRLAENGIRITGDGGAQGALTAEDLKKLDKDPRIDPANRDHKDPAQRYDESLRKQYDDAYARIYPSR